MIMMIKKIKIDHKESTELSLEEKYPTSYVYKPSERMLRYRKEFERKNTNTK